MLHHPAPAELDAFQFIKNAFQVKAALTRRKMQFGTRRIAIGKVDTLNARAELADGVKISVRRSHTKVTRIVDDAEILRADRIEQAAEPIDIDTEREGVHFDEQVDAAIRTVFARLLKKRAGSVEDWSVDLIRAGPVGTSPFEVADVSGAEIGSGIDIPFKSQQGRLDILGTGQRLKVGHVARIEPSDG